MRAEEGSSRHVTGTCLENRKNNEGKILCEEEEGKYAGMPEQYKYYMIRKHWRKAYQMKEPLTSCEEKEIYLYMRLYSILDYQAQWSRLGMKLIVKEEEAEEIWKMWKEGRNQEKEVYQLKYSDMRT